MVRKAVDILFESIDVESPQCDLCGKGFPRDGGYRLRVPEPLEGMRSSMSYCRPCSQEWPHYRILKNFFTTSCRIWDGRVYTEAASRGALGAFASPDLSRTT